MAEPRDGFRVAVTTLGCLRVGDMVNLELDVVAKYVDRQARAAIAAGGVA